MNKSIKINYWWKCDKFPKEIPYELEECLKESAEERISHALKEGFCSGELLDSVNIEIEGKKTPEDGFECYGGYTIEKKDE